jgi:hypothetical protein
MSEGLTLQRVAVRDAYASAAARAELDAEISELTLLAEQHEGQAAGPGGTLVFANMLDSHPQLAFTLNVIQWPYLTPRSVDQVEALMHAAGLPADESSAFVAEDGVYAVYVSTDAPASGGGV